MDNVVNLDDQRFIEKTKTDLTKARDARDKTLAFLNQSAYALPMVNLLEQYSAKMFYRMTVQKDMLDFTNYTGKLTASGVDGFTIMTSCLVRISDDSAISADITRGLPDGNIFINLTMRYVTGIHWDDTKSFDRAAIMTHATSLFDKHATAANCGCSALYAYLESLLLPLEEMGYSFYPYWDEQCAGRMDRISFTAMKDGVWFGVVVHGQRYLDHLTLLNAGFGSEDMK